MSQDKKRSKNIEMALEKLDSARALKKYSNPDSNWDLVQELLQEIMATHTISNPDSQPKVPTLLKELKKEIEIRYAEDDELRKLMLARVPAARSVREWLKKDGWDDAVWEKLRVDGLFTRHKRAEMIDALFLRGKLKSDAAAKIWLTLSGDYVEKQEVNNKTTDVYREINKVIHKTNKIED